MKKTKENATFVIANYNFSDARQFSNELKSSESFNSLGADFSEVKVNVQSNIPLPEDFPLPIAIYRNKFSQIAYSAEDHKLDISSKDYKNENELLKNLLKTLAQFKLQEISAIGINYHADCCTSDKRLCLFNEKINNQTISNWDKNIGFKVILPIELDDKNCLATYSIQKVQGGKNENDTTEDYIYRISVNYNFDIKEDKADVMKRFARLEEIIGNIDNLHSDFEQKCKEITDL